MTTACGKDVFDLGRNLIPLLKNNNNTNSSRLDDIITVSSSIIRNLCTQSCSPAISEFFKSIQENQECRNTTLAVTKIGNPTAYQLASVLAVGNALVCTNNSSCIMDQIATARKVIADHPPTALGSDLFALLGNRSFVCNSCTKSQSMAVQNSPIKDLDVELQGNMGFFVDRLEKKCSSPDGFSDIITPSTNGSASASGSSSSSNTPQKVPSSALKIDIVLSLYSFASIPFVFILMLNIM